MMSGPLTDEIGGPSERVFARSRAGSGAIAGSRAAQGSRKAFIAGRTSLGRPPSLAVLPRSPSCRS